MTACQPTARAILQCYFDAARAVLEATMVDTAVRATSNTAPIAEQISGCKTQRPRSAVCYSLDLPPGLVLGSLGKAGRLAPTP